MLFYAQHHNPCCEFCAVFGLECLLCRLAILAASYWAICLVSLVTGWDASKHRACNYIVLLMWCAFDFYYVSTICFLMQTKQARAFRLFRLTTDTEQTHCFVVAAKLRRPHHTLNASCSAPTCCMIWLDEIGIIWISIPQVPTCVFTRLTPNLYESYERRCIMQCKKKLTLVTKPLVTKEISMLLLLPHAWYDVRLLAFNVCCRTLSTMLVY